MAVLFGQVCGRVFPAIPLKRFWLAHRASMQRDDSTPAARFADKEALYTPLSEESSPMKDVQPTWVLVHKLCELTGYSDDAVRAKMRRGEWQRDVHWRKAPDNRIVLNAAAIQRWMGGEHHA